MYAYVSALCPLHTAIAAAAVRRVEEEYRRRLEGEYRAMREASEKEAEGGHLRAVALKAQLVEVQGKLQVRACVWVCGAARWTEGWGLGTNMCACPFANAVAAVG
jgi:hypothetical protein